MRCRPCLLNRTSSITIIRVNSLESGLSKLCLVQDNATVSFTFCGLFNDTVSKSYCIASNVRIIEELEGIRKETVLA